MYGKRCGTRILLYRCVLFLVFVHYSALYIIDVAFLTVTEVAQGIILTCTTSTTAFAKIISLIIMHNLSLSKRSHSIERRHTHTQDYVYVVNE